MLLSPGRLVCAIVVLVAASDALVRTGDSSPRHYTGHSVIRVKSRERPTTAAVHKLIQNAIGEVEYMRQAGGDDGHFDIRVSPTTIHLIVNTLRRLDVPHQLLTDDLQREIDNEKSRRLFRQSVYPDSSLPIQEPDNYLTYDEIISWLLRTAQICGDVCKLRYPGVSYEGRQLVIMQIGEAKQDKPAVWVDAGLHAREWIGPSTALSLIAKLISAHLLNSEAGGRGLTEFTWYILPVANPDGYVYTWTHDRLWRKTRSEHPNSSCIGADPNRNWNFHWAGAGTSDDPCSENYHGRYPFSEPEVSAISSFLWRFRHRLVLYISLHSYGQYWLTPWGFTYDVPPDYAEMMELARIAVSAAKRENGTTYKYGSSSRLLYRTSGSSDDWTKGVAGVKYAYTIELGDTGRNGFLLPRSAILPTGRDTFNALKAITTEMQKRRHRRP